MKPRKPSPRREHSKGLPEWTKRLNASQRGLLTKFTRTGQVDPRNRVTEERPIRRAAWERRRAEEAKQKQQQQEAA